MPKVTSLGHLGFYVKDVERSVAFYRDILGLQVSDRSPRGSVFMTAQDRLAEHREPRRRQRILPGVLGAPSPDPADRDPRQHGEHLLRGPRWQLRRSLLADEDRRAAAIRQARRSNQER
jgi:catechol 2,3-dioxygenase-like lactoylglutathione lyase family enzyme